MSKLVTNISVPDAKNAGLQSTMLNLPFSSFIVADADNFTKSNVIASCPPMTMWHGSSILPRLASMVKVLDSVMSDARRQRRKIHASNRILAPRYDSKNPTHVQSLHAEHTLIVMLDVLHAVRLMAKNVGTIPAMPGALLPALYITRMAVAHLYDVMDSKCGKMLSEVSICIGSIILDAAILSGAKLDLGISNKESSMLIDQAKLTASSKLKKQYPKLDLSGACSRCY